jgi:hypothetical protein
MAMMSGFGFDGSELDNVRGVEAYVTDDGVIRFDEREDEDNTYDPDGPYPYGNDDMIDDALAPCGCYADDPGCPHKNTTDEDEPEFQLCECELDWRCPLHRGQPTPLELQNDAWASVQTAIDAQNGM